MTIEVTLGQRARMGIDSLSGRRLRRLLRSIEAMTVARTKARWALIPDELARRARCRTARIADGFATLFESSSARHMNRVVGLGHRGRATKRAVDEIVDFYAASRVRRCAVMLGPGPQSKAIEGWLRARGFEKGAGHLLLLRPVGTRPPRVSTRLRIARARRREVPMLVDIAERVFGMPLSRRAWSLEQARRYDYVHYAAYDGARPVGVASMRSEGELAWFGGAAVLTRWRRHGAHRALIGARLRRSARLGCRWAWVETSAPTPGRAGGSRRNLIAMGFEALGEKPLWTLDLR